MDLPRRFLAAPPWRDPRHPRPRASVGRYVDRLQPYWRHSNQIDLDVHFAPNLPRFRSIISCTARGWTNGYRNNVTQCKIHLRLHTYISTDQITYRQNPKIPSRTKALVLNRNILKNFSDFAVSLIEEYANLPK